VTGQLLNRLRRRAPHREVRAERVAKNVKSPRRRSELRAPLGGGVPRAEDLLRRRPAVVRVENALTAKMPEPLERGGRNPALPPRSTRTSVRASIFEAASTSRSYSANS
jgi:hypothetical protein